MEAEALDAGRGAVIVGDAGVGKSRVLLELCDRLEAAGLAVHRIAATTSLSTVPYGALAAALSGLGDHGGDELSVLQHALSELRADRDARQTVIALDDAHLLDRGSAALAALAARSGVPVLATLRRAEPCPDGVTALWRDELATRVDLHPLDVEGVGEMLTLALGAPVDAHTRYRLWERTAGNLLFLRELVRAGITRGALAEHGDVWIWTGRLGGAARVHDLLRDTVTSVPPAARRVLELLALGEPLGASIVDELSGPGALGTAELAGLAVAERVGRRLEVRLVHPMYAHVVRESLGRVRTEQASREIADAMTGSGRRRSDDVLRIASFQLAAGPGADADVLLKAARQARQYADIELAEELARQAFVLGGGAAAAITLAEALYWQGRHDEVLDLLTGGILDDAAPKHIVAATIQITSALVFGQGHLTAANVWLQRAIERVGPTHEADLLAWRARLLFVSGRAAECIAVARGVLARPDASPLARLSAMVPLLSALAQCGRLQEVAENGAVARDLASTAGRGLPSAVGPVTVGIFVAHLFDGHLRDFDPVLASLNEAAMQRAEDPYRGVWTFLLGRSAFAQGQLAQAIPLLREAAALLHLHDPGVMLPWCLATLTQALGASDDARGARAACEHLDALRLDVCRHLDVEIELARAWTAAAYGNRSQAREVALAVARRLHADGRVALAAMAYHDALRLGAPADVVMGPLDDIANVAEGPVIAAMAAHANAVTHRDHLELAAAADAFDSAGMMLHAAEAMADAARLAGQAGLRSAASGLRVRAAALAARCGPALTPLLESVSGRDALAVLTRKEQEVALMAARGMTKRAIAESLSVSPRTVGNHINHLYAKLGVSTRNELRSVCHM
jgi:DNA-binding CsgD family transcriptional regulator